MDHQNIALYPVGFMDRVLRRAMMYMGAAACIPEKYDRYDEETGAGDSTDIDTDIRKLIALTRQAVDDLLELDSFRICHEMYTLVFDDDRDCFHITELSLDLPSKDLNRYFKGCDHIIVEGCTLGVAAERLVRKLQLPNITYSAVVDATAGALLESLCDEAEKTFTELNMTSPDPVDAHKGQGTPDIPRTFRFAPGYGDLPLTLNIPLAEAISMQKRIGVSYTSGGLFVPQKSMLGIIGTGRQNLNRDCGLCTNMDNCTLRKGGERCWI